MDSNPICHPSPTKKMKCSFLDYIQLLMISRAGQWTEIPFATPLQPKKLNVCFWIMFNFWWSAMLVNGFKPHPPPLSSQKNEMFVFGLCSTSDDQPGWSMDSNPICHPSPAEKMKCSFLDYFQFLEINQAGRWTQTRSTTPLQPKNDMLILRTRSTSDDWPGWSMDSKPICNPSPTKKMKCSFLDYVQLLMISQAGWRTPTPSATSFQPKKWNAHFFIMFKFWWSAELVDRLEPHLPPISNQKNEMLVFVLRYTSDDQPGWSMGSKPIHHPSSQKNEMLIFVLCSTSDDWRGWSINSNRIHYPSPAKKWNAHFWITFNFWWSARLVDGLKPHPAPLSSQKMKCSFLDYVQLLMISQAGRRTATPSVTPLQPKKWNAHFWIMLNFWWLAGLVNRLEPHLPSLSKQKNDMLILVLHSSSDHWPGWSMDSNPICNLSPGIKWNTHFCITFNLWWSAGLVNGLKPHLPPLSSQKNEMLIFGLHSTSDDQLGWLMDSNPICHPSPTKKNEMLIFGFGWSAGLVDELESHLPPLSSQKKWNAHFWLHQLNWQGWSINSNIPPLSSHLSLQDSNPIHHPSPAKKWNAHFWIMFNFWWSARRPKDCDPICHPSPTKKMKCLFLYYGQLLMISWAGW